MLVSHPHEELLEPAFSQKEEPVPRPQSDEATEIQPRHKMKSGC